MNQPELFQRIGGAFALHIYFPRMAGHNNHKSIEAGNHLVKPIQPTAPGRKSRVTRAGWVFLSQPKERD
jgi:hypothetical protein